MPHQFLALLEGLKDRLARMSAMVQQAVEQATEAVFATDTRLAQQVIALDRKIDEEEVVIEKQAIDLLALHQPTAGDLRLITTVIKVNNDLERIADSAVNIAQRVQPLAHANHYQPPEDLRLMANSVLGILRDTIKAFNLMDESVARHVLRADDVVDALYAQIVQDMLTMMQKQAEGADTDLTNIMIAKNLERIAEDIIYVHTGRIIRHAHFAEAERATPPRWT